MAGQARVDRECGIIYGVKVCGKSSPNKHGLDNVDGTDYTEAAFREALSYYEGCNVNINHPPRAEPNQERDCHDRFAWLQECKVSDGELFGNLHFLDPTDSLAVRIMNAAEQKPDAFQLSHNAYGEGTVRNRRYVIEHLVWTPAFSVDIVTRGATNRSLFESQEQRIPQTTLRKILESRPAGVRAKFRKLLEMGGLGEEIADKPMDAPEEGAGHEDDLVAAIGKLVKSSDPADHEKAQKIMKILKPEVAEPVAEADDDDDANLTDEEKKKKKDEEEAKKVEEARDAGGHGADNAKERAGMYGSKTGMRARGIKMANEESLELATLREERNVRILCESLHFSPTQLHLDALVGVGDDKKRKALIETFRGAGSGRPRSQPAGTGYTDTTKKSFVAALRG